MVIIMAAPGDGLAADVHQKCLERDSECLVFPPPGGSSPVDFNWRLPDTAWASLPSANRKIDMGEITGILVRALPEPPPDTCTESDDYYLALEWRAALLGWLQAVPAPVVDRPIPGKLFRLPALCAYADTFRACGLPLAPVLVTDSGADARSFLSRCGGSALMMPGVEGQPVPVRDEGERDDAVTCLIALPHGVRRRIHVAGKDAFAEILDGPIPDDPLPETLAVRCCAVARRLALPFMELEVVSSDDGDVVVGAGDLLEAEFRDPGHREEVAGALATILSRGRR